MSSIYLVFKYDYTNIYDENGNLLEFEINGKKTNKIYNTVKFNYDTHNLDMAPDTLPLESYHYSLFEEESEICGMKYISAMKLVVFMEYLFSRVIKEKYDKLYIIISDDLIRKLYEKKQEQRTDVFIFIHDYINAKKLNIKMHCEEPLHEFALIHSLLEHAANDYPDGLCYINDVAVLSCFTKNNIVSYYTKAYKKLADIEKLENDFEDYLNKKGLIVNEDTKKGILVTLRSLVTNNDNETIEYIHQDERFILDCKMVKDYFNSLREQEKNNIKAVLDESILSNKFKCIIDIEDEEYSNVVINHLKEKGIENISMQDRHSFNQKLIKYCYYVIKYNGALYQRNAIPMFKRKVKGDIDQILTRQGRLYYSFFLYLNKFEHQKLLKELGYSYNPDLYKHRIR